MTKADYVRQCFTKELSRRFLRLYQREASVHLSLSGKIMDKEPKSELTVPGFEPGLSCSLGPNFAREQDALPTATRPLLVVHLGLTSQYTLNEDSI